MSEKQYIFIIDTSSTMKIYGKSFLEHTKEIINNIFSKKPNLSVGVLKYRDVGSTSEYITTFDKFVTDKQILMDNLKNTNFSDGGYKSALIESLCQASDLFDSSAVEKEIIIITCSPPHENFCYYCGNHCLDDLNLKDKGIKLSIFMPILISKLLSLYNTNMKDNKSLKQYEKDYKNILLSNSISISERSKRSYEMIKSSIPHQELGLPTNPSILQNMISHNQVPNNLINNVPTISPNTTPNVPIISGMSNMSSSSISNVPTISPNMSNVPTLSNPIIPTISNSNLSNMNNSITSNPIPTISHQSHSMHTNQNVHAPNPSKKGKVESKQNNVNNNNSNSMAYDLTYHQNLPTYVPNMGVVNGEFENESKTTSNPTPSNTINPNNLLNNMSSSKNVNLSGSMNSVSSNTINPNNVINSMNTINPNSMINSMNNVSSNSLANNILNNNISISNLNLPSLDSPLVERPKRNSGQPPIMPTISQENEVKPNPPFKPVGKSVLWKGTISLKAKNQNYSYSSQIILPLALNLPTELKIVNMLNFQKFTQLFTKKSSDFQVDINHGDPDKFIDEVKKNKNVIIILIDDRLLMTIYFNEGKFVGNIVPKPNTKFTQQNQQQNPPPTINPQTMSSYLGNPNLKLSSNPNMQPISPTPTPTITQENEVKQTPPVKTMAKPSVWNGTLSLKAKNNQVFTYSSKMILPTSSLVIPPELRIVNLISHDKFLQLFQKKSSDFHVEINYNEPDKLIDEVKKNKTVIIISIVVLLMIRRPPRSTRLPYTTLFRTPQASNNNVNPEN
eukprot:TRINITY_DN4357_c0_g1_i3.p1 TRINITY_DN4357_c0_g1~~TRINITY_DN4357_c0_g1_i3.p1  ORF type:complete len:790 (-),score=204.80 TRINITY_DN4357_c0_g1_i3:445-2814(-)